MELTDLLPQVAAMLIGGLTTSLALGAFVRRPRGRAILGRTRPWAITLFGGASVALLVGGFYRGLQSVGSVEDAAALLASPWVFLLIGAVAGLPFALPGIVMTWSEERPGKVAARQQKAKKATRDDRLAYALDLVGQIQDVALTKREITASVTGEKGRILLFEGDLERQEGDRLVAALRTDLKGLGFERLEGKGPRGNWWAPV